MTKEPSAKKAAAEIESALKPLSRRRFLKNALWASAGLAAVAAGGFALLGRSAHDNDAVPADLAHIEPAQYRLFNQLALVLLPTAGTALPPVAEIPVARHVDAILGALTPDIRKQLAGGLALLDNAAIFSHGKRLIDLEPADAQAYLASWVDSDSVIKRTLGQVATKLTHTGYWMDERTWPVLEFDGAVSRKWGLPSRGNQPLPA